MLRLAVAALLAFALAMTPAQAQADPGRALRVAAASGDSARVAQLIEQKAPLDAGDAQGQTALLLAVQANQLEAARTLIAAGASINAQAANKDTPWLLAGASGRTEMIALMIPRGPDLSIRNRFGGDALIPACERGHVETIRLLLTTKIDVNHLNNLGWTCLLEIVILGDGGPRHQEAARLVLGAGANPNLADRNGVTPLAHARGRGKSAVAEIIAGAGGR